MLSEVNLCAVGAQGAARPQEKHVQFCSEVCPEEGKAFLVTQIYEEEKEAVSILSQSSG